MLAAAVLALIASPLTADVDSPTLAEDVCEAPFSIVVPGDLVRERQALSLVLHYTDAEDHVRLDVSRGEVAVTLLRGGAPSALGRGGFGRLPKGADIVVARRAGSLVVAAGPDTVVRAQAELPEGGKWGIVDAEDGDLDEVWFQQAGGPVFSDDFMRGPDDTGAWTAIEGSWQVAALPSARFSANAFTYVGAQSSDRSALATAGEWFWGDYTVEAAVRPSRGAEGFGVAACCDELGNYHALRYLPGRLELLRVRGGKGKTLAAAEVRIALDEWHRVGLSVVGEELVGVVDGAERLRVVDPRLSQGQVGLLAEGPAPVAFDDVRVYPGPPEPAPATVLSLSAEAAEAGADIFINDTYMKQWSDESGQWVVAEDAAWHTGVFWGDFELAWRATPQALGSPVTLHACVPPNGTLREAPADTTSGYHLEIAPAKADTLSVALRRGEEALATGECATPGEAVTVALRRNGSELEASIGGEVVASATDEALLPVGKVGLTAPSAGRQVGGLSVTSWNVLDSTFRSAPTAWRIVDGDWGVQSRWACTPRWSWFGGRSEDLAAAWTRQEFAGDIVVEFYAGLPMDQAWAPFYQHPGNYCVTLCGDGRSPGSGYSFVFAGWGNTATGLYRRGELVAQTPDFPMPDILDSLGGQARGTEELHELHNDWWKLRAERSGATLRLFVEGELALTYEDPDPLPGGAVGLWTVDNGITVARARIYYERTREPEPVEAPQQPASPRPALAVTTDQPEHYSECFEAQFEGWVAASGESCAVGPAEREDGSRCLRVENTHAGGSFALRAPVAGVDLTKRPLLAFEYAIPEGVAVDVFVTAQGQAHRLRLSGPEEPVPGVEELGEVAGARADGRWRWATVDLLGRLRRLYRSEESLAIEALEFANYSRADYLHAGIGANAAGASYQLDNVFLGSPVREPVAVSAPRGAKLSRRASRGKVKATASGVVPVTATSGRSVGADVVAWDVDAPSVEASEQGGLEFRVEDAGPSGIDEASLSVAVGEQTFAWPAPEVVWEPAEGLLRVELGVRGEGATGQAPRRHAATASQGWGSGAKVRVGPIRDRAGNEAAPLEVTVTPAAGEAEAGRTDTIGNDFETDLGELGPWGADAGCEVRRAHTPCEGNPRGGDWCAEVRNTQIGGLFGLDLGVEPFEASRYPVLRFDYRAPETLRVDLLVELPDARCTVKFTDFDATWQVIGNLQAVADNAWRTAELDLHTALKQAFPNRASLPVVRLALASSGWPGNRRDTRYWLDNIELLPAEGGESGDATPPVASGPEPADRACLRRLVFDLQDEGSGVSPADIRLTVNGSELSIADEWLTYNEAGSTLTYDPPGPLGADGETITYELQACDLAGNAMEPLSGGLTLDYSLDSSPPPAPVASYAPGDALFANDFAEDRGLWGDFLSCQALRRDTGGASGPECVELRDLRNWQGTCYGLVEDFGPEWRDYPVVRFRYRFTNPGGSATLMGTAFDGDHEQWVSLGGLSGGTDEWQTACIDMSQALAGRDLTLHRLFLSLSLPGAMDAIYIDDYAMYSPTATRARFGWSEPPDESGIGGYAWALDGSDGTVPPEAVTGSERTAEFTGLEPGHYCFHVRARDGAGNWGPAAHVPLDVAAP